MQYFAYLAATMLSSLNARFTGRKDRGATAVEYGLLVGLIAVVIIVAVVALGGTLLDMFTNVVEALGGTVGEGEGTG